MNQKKPAIYFYGDLRIKGWIENAKYGLYWFKADNGTLFKDGILVSKDELLNRLK